MEENQIEIPDGWVIKPLVSLVFKMQSGGTPKSDNPEYYNGQIPFVAIQDLTSTNKYLANTKKKITFQGLRNSSAWIVPKNSLMYSIYATLGVPRINIIEAATNQAILNMIPNEGKIDLEFLFYLLSEKRATILAHSAHTTQSNLNARIIKELEFLFPKCLQEQQKIAQILSKVDAAISQTEALIAKYQHIKTGLMQDLLTKGIDENGNIRSEETHEFKDSALGRIPKEWEIENTDRLFDMILGKMLNKDAVQGKNLFPYLGNKNVQWGDFNLSELQEMSFSENERAKYNLKIGDLLVCEGGEVGRCAIWNIPNSSFFFQKAIHRLRPISSKIRIEYMFEYMVYITQKSLFNDFISQTSIKHFTQEKFKLLPILLPSITEQQRIVSISKKQDSLLFQEKSKLHKLQSLKTGLMQDLLSGRKTIHNLLK